VSVHTTYALRVQYEDTDFSGYVYHANYLKFCERARSDFTRQKGIDQNANFSGPDGIAFVVRHMDCHFLRPARFGDDLIVATEFIEIVGARFEAFQQVKLGEAVLFTAAVTVALIDSKGRPRRCPPEMLKAFTQAF
jgi:acyl-CoA thioester hydrolase